LLAFACSVRADYKDDYAHGVKAYEAGDYGAAQKALQQALEAHAEPAARVRLYGQVFAPYVPQHYLGLIALKQGDCTALHAQWGSSENRQIILQLPDIASEEQRAGAACGEKAVAKTETPPKPPEKPPVEKPPTTETPPKTVAVIPPPKPPVVPPPVPPKPPEKLPVEKPPVAEKTAPPDNLVQAFDQYLGGRYTEVARINPDAFADSRARFHAYLVRAAAKYTQARLAGDDALLTSAKADAAAARALDAHTTPDATLFSPAFREFYQAAR
jgi:outer membrane biosynthesis protein TonB